MDGPYQVLNLISPQNGWTPPRVKTIVHKVNRTGKGKKKKKILKVDRPSIKTHVHDVDGPNKVNIKATSNRTDPTLPSSTK